MRAGLENRAFAGNLPKAIAIFRKESETVCTGQRGAYLRIESLLRKLAEVRAAATLGPNTAARLPLARATCLARSCVPN